MHFEDGTSADFDVIVYATGYNITFPFFDQQLISAPENQIRPVQADVQAGHRRPASSSGFAQSTPTLFPFVEAQARLLAAYCVGRYALPGVEEMERMIDADHALYLGHMLDRPRHTHQLDYFVYEHDLRTRELPHGMARAAR